MSRSITLWSNRIRPHLKRRGTIVGYALLAVVYGYVVVKLAQSWQSINWNAYRLDVRYLVFALVPHILGLGLAGVGWALVLRAVSPGQGFWKSVRIYFISNIGRNLPGGVWYIVGRVYLQERAGASKTVTAIAMAMELALTVLAGAAVYVIGLLMSPMNHVIAPEWLIAVLVLECVLLCPPILNRLVNVLVQRFARGASTVVVAWGMMLRWVVLYLTLVLMGGLILFLVINAIYPLGWANLPVVVGAWGISVAIGGLTFWIPVQIGIRDGIMVVALSVLMPFSAALIIAIIWRVFVSVSELFWALVVAILWRLR